MSEDQIYCRYLLYAFTPTFLISFFLIDNQFWQLKAMDALLISGLWSFPALIHGIFFK